MELTHVGNSFIPTCFSDITLLNVLDVPQIAKTLLSVSYLTKDNNITIEFNASRCLFKDLHLKEGCINLTYLLH